MAEITQSSIRRVRIVSGSQVQDRPSQESVYRGFGSGRGETLEEFHDRMFDLEPLEAMLYEMEISLM
jgi:hypothetical protein